MNIFVTEKPEHGKREADGRCTYCKLIWPVWSPDFEPAWRVVYLLENLTRPSNSQPWSVSNEERTGTVGPQQVNLAGRRLLGLRVGCLSPCLTLLSLSGSICLSFSFRCLALRPCIYPTVLPVSHYSHFAARCNYKLQIYFLVGWLVCLVCLSAGLQRKLLKGFQWNLNGGWILAQNRPHSVWGGNKGQIQDFNIAQYFLEFLKNKVWILMLNPLNCSISKWNSSIFLKYIIFHTNRPKIHISCLWKLSQWQFTK